MTYKTTKPTHQYSKQIVNRSWFAAIVLTTIVVICTIMQINTSDLTQIALFSWGEVAAAHCFYYWKARSENRSRHAMQLVRDLADQYGIDAVVGLAGVVLQE
jgi:hypothetical protein